MVHNSSCSAGGVKSTKKPKVPKGAGGKEPKSAKGSAAAVTASPSAQTTSQTTSQPTNELTYALLTLKASFTNGNEILSDWVSTTEPCSGDDSNWTYITCSAGKVTQIILGK